MELDTKRQEILRLLDRCPVPKCESRDCPLSCNRERSVNEQIEWVVELSYKELEELCEHHNKCYPRRMAEKQ